MRVVQSVTSVSGDRPGDGGDEFERGGFDDRLDPFRLWLVARIDHQPQGQPLPSARACWRIDAVDRRQELALPQGLGQAVDVADIPFELEVH